MLASCLRPRQLVQAVLIPPWPDVFKQQSMHAAVAHAQALKPATCAVRFSRSARRARSARNPRTCARLLSGLIALANPREGKWCRITERATLESFRVLGFAIVSKLETVKPNRFNSALTSAGACKGAFGRCMGATKEPNEPIAGVRGAIVGRMRRLSTRGGNKDDTGAPAGNTAPRRVTTKLGVETVITKKPRETHRWAVKTYHGNRRAPS